MRESEAQKLNFLLIFSLVLIFCFNGSQCSSLHNSLIFDQRADNLLPEISPTGNPEPLYPLLGPSPFTITNNTAPKLSGLCTLDFDAIDTMRSITATDCFTVFAPYLANVVCCPQLEATLVILIGQSSKKTKTLSLNSTHAKHCLSDFDQILTSQGADNTLQQICSVGPSNLTEASCPVKDVDGFEKMVNTCKILASCGKIDLVNECCRETCQNAISEAAKDLASVSNEFDAMGIRRMSDISTRVINDCKSIVLRWLRAKEALRGLANCNLNKGKCGKVDIARVLFQGLIDKGLQLDVRTYNVMISGFCREGQLGEAKLLFLKMDQSGCPPDNVTYRVFLQGCLKNKHYDDIKMLLKEMDGRGYSLDASTLSLFIDQIAAGCLDRSMLKLLGKLV